MHEITLVDVLKLMNVGSKKSMLGTADMFKADLSMISLKSMLGKKETFHQRVVV